MRVQAALPVTAVLLALFFTPLSSHAADLRACDLLSAQSAALLAGGPVGDASDMEGVACSYTTGPKGVTVGVTLTDAQGANGSFSIQSVRMLAKKGDTMETIPRLGEQNLLLITIGDNDTLMVIYHHKAISLGVHRHMTPALRAEMVKTMRQILTKL